MNPWLALILMTLDTFILTKLVVDLDFPPVLWLRDRVVGGWRDATQHELNDQSWLPMAGREQIFREIEGVPSRYVYRWNWVPLFFAELMSCPWCTSGWVSAGTVAGTWLAVGLPVPVLMWPAVWALGSLMAQHDYA